MQQAFETATRVTAIAVIAGAIVGCSKPEAAVGRPYAGFWLDDGAFLAIHDTTYFAERAREVENEFETPLLTLIEPDGTAVFQAALDGGADAVYSATRRSNGDVEVVVEDYPAAYVARISPTGELLSTYRITAPGHDLYARAFDSGSSGQAVIGGQVLRVANIVSVVDDRTAWAYRLEDESHAVAVDTDEAGTVALLVRYGLGATPKDFVIALFESDGTSQWQAVFEAHEDDDVFEGFQVQLAADGVWVRRGASIHHLDLDGTHVSSFVVPEGTRHWAALGGTLGVVTEVEANVLATWYESSGAPIGSMRLGVAGGHQRYEFDENSLRIATVGTENGGSIPIAIRHVELADDAGCESEPVEQADLVALAGTEALELMDTSVAFLPAEFDVDTWKKVSLEEIGTSADVTDCP